MKRPDLTINDFNKKLTMKGSRLNVLAAVAEKALEKFRQHTRRWTKRSKSNSPPPPLPEEFANKIQEIANGKVLTPATLVIEKCLFTSDINKDQNRLSIPVSQVVSDGFLNDDEKRLIQSYVDAETETNSASTKKKGKKKNYIKVKMIDPSLNVETLKFCQWDMEKTNGGKTTSNYVIYGKWSHIVNGNDLRKETRVQLWSFRIDQELCFALVRLPPT